MYIYAHTLYVMYVHAYINIIHHDYIYAKFGSSPGGCEGFVHPRNRQGEAKTR